MTNETSPPPPALVATGHVPALDGVRGLAILLVMLFHSTLIPVHTRFDDYYTRLIGMGWAGVDLFFVLSGFLITGILYDAKGKGRFFLNFYGRRVVRIFPLYYLYLLIAFHVVPSLFGVNDFVAAHEPWYWLYLTNILHWVEPEALPLDLAITWSLSVEEQFYIVWPLVVCLAGRRGLMIISAAVVVLSPLARWGLLLNGGNPSIIYSFTLTRLDTLLAGAWVALAVRDPGMVDFLRRWSWRVLLAAAAVVIGVFVVEKKFTIHGFLVQSAGFSALACGGAALIARIMVVPQGSWLPRAFNNRFLRLLGKHSYSMYLFHVAIQFWVTHHVFGRKEVEKMAMPMLGQLVVYAMVIGGTLVVALVTWYAMEMHFLKLRRYFRDAKPALRTASAPLPPGEGGSVREAG